MFTRPQRMGGALVVFALILLIAYSIFERILTDFLSGVISSDHEISYLGIMQLRMAVYYINSVILAAGLVLLMLRHESVNKLFRRLFLNDLVETLPVYAKPGVILVTGLVLSALQFLNMRLLAPHTRYFEAMFGEDRLFESLTPIFMLAAAIMLGISARRAASAHSRVAWLILVIWLAMAAAFIFDAGEEISWGQRIFHWNTPVWFAKANVQDETNVHNLFNDYFDAAYRILLVVPAAVYASIGLTVLRKMRPAWSLVMPHPSLAGLALVIGFIAAVMPLEQELLEELVSLFALLYALRVFVLSRRAETVRPSDVAQVRHRLELP